ncbi:DUF885 domain-containing protein [Novosphingobium piscinae]|uniref:DUF885 domain-containing protein n=1 Tax=Novosphingobium piscinae TaxID=1507448 RepID=A0A7X1FX77_9SPHN|nr:DUF885 family protein [Novosphingobium piscinae]MBC2668611.1 DUF885 domain-containing protein [Novosphingobium piscinae]
MDRRHFLGGTAAVALASRATGVLAAAPADARLVSALDRQYFGELMLQPEQATALGLDKGPYAALKSQLNDYGEGGRQTMLRFNRAARDELRAIAPASLGPEARRYREVALYRAEVQLEPDAFGLSSAQSPYPISQQDGAYFGIPDFLANQHTIETVADAEAYIARLTGFAGALDAESEVQRNRAGRGVIAPVWSLDLALGQMRKLREVPPEQNGLVLSLVQRATAKGLPGDWARRATQIVATAVYPALDRQIALVETLKRSTPAGDGAWRLRDGDAIYAMALRHATTTSLTPDEVHRIGLEQVAELTARLDAVLRSAGYTQGSVGARLVALNTAADQLFPNTDAGRAALIASLNADVGRMTTLLPKAFNRLPSEALDVRRVPPDIQDGAPNGYYNPSALDGTRPAIYWINLKDTADWPKYQQRSLTYHEGVPGHHLQIGSARLGGDLPKLLQSYYISSYGEGWALYAEQLADELGGYDGIERAGYLQSFLFRATRLVVDTGLNHKRWSREQATRYMVETTGFTQGRSQREIERYCASVGQACSYKIGHNKWLELRDRAQRRLGAKFSLGWFHEVLLEGAMPLALLERRVDERIAARLAAG